MADAERSTTGRTEDPVILSGAKKLASGATDEEILRSAQSDSGSAISSPAREPAGPTAFTIRVGTLAWCGVLVLAALFRLTDLGALPLRPDEGLRARAALEFARGDVTEDWTGDLSGALTALMLMPGDDSETTARLPGALLGVVAVAALALYRRLIGDAAALVGALLIAISPVAVVAARSVGPETAALPLALLVPPLAASIWLDGRWERLPWLGLLVGFGLSSGAMFAAVLVVVAAWIGVEIGWLDGRARRDETVGATHASPLPAARRDGARQAAPLRLVLVALALIPGLLLATLRYGAGPDRVTLGAVDAWNWPPALGGPQLTWHYLLNVLIAYEPLALVLGIVGAGWTLAHWSRPADAGGRLLVIWGAVGAALVALWLHGDPARVQLVTVPLALLGGIGTARLSAAATRRGIGRAALASLALVPGFGFTLVMLVYWAEEERIIGGEALAVGFVALGGVVAALAIGWLLKAPLRLIGLLAAWVVLGGLTLHASSFAAFEGGTEILTGQRARPEVAALLRNLDAVAAPGEPVWVERELWPALAWPLRDRPLRRFVAVAPGGPAIYPVDERVTDVDVARSSAAVAERWAPDGWDTFGILRWWVRRTPWGATPTTYAVARDEG